MRNQKGFTLIELIIVIVVLGILAVTAAPQFFNFSGDARESAVKGLKGNIQGAYQTVYAKAAVEGKLAGTADSLTKVEDIQTIYGYPAAVDDTGAIITDGIIEAATLSDADWDWAVSTNSSDDTIVIAPAGYGTDDSVAEGCYVTYQQTDSADTPPTVAINVEGCSN
ncbi:type II secretion system protein [Idiomarina sp.]|uniref:prepilin-type N-terminal cleavage/methylation domain-containing protein n=1 Tax=Idiomarina sp. TaxID=1874361 RepID=UPI0025BE2D96|nr:type II secretion system protein [Idiomarina sp.]NQZ03257.1 type II secretion system protein [Idiomarina sp.]